MNMKKWFCALLAVLMALSVAACKGGGEDPQDTTASAIGDTTVPDTNGETEGSTTQAPTNGATEIPTTQEPTQSGTTASGGNTTGGNTTGGNSTGGNTTGGNTTGGNTTGGNTTTGGNSTGGNTTTNTATALTVGSNAARPKDANGQCFTWTATQDATLVLTMPDKNWACRVDNETSGIKGTKYKSSDVPLMNPISVSVLKGDVLKIYVATSSGVAGSVTFTAAVEAAMGTKDNPLTVNREGSYLLRVPAGQTMYVSGRVDGTTLLLTNGSTAKVTVNGKSYGPAATVEAAIDKQKVGNTSHTVFTVKNTSGSLQSYTLSFSVPQGTFETPSQLKIGSNTATVKSGATEGYYFTWTATANGTLTLTMPSGQTWLYNLTNTSNMETISSEEKENQNPISITVKKGQVVKIEIAPTDRNGDITEGSVTFTAAFK